MSETKEPEKRQETPQEREKRLKRQRILRERRRKKRRKILILRGILGLVVLAVLVGIVFFVSGMVQKHSEKQKEKEEKAAVEAIQTEEVDFQSVMHLSFSSLIAMPETAFGQEDTQAAANLDQGHLTVDEFNQILQQLYDKGYVLVSIRDLVKAEGKDGKFSAEKLILPKGKKPLIISQQNVNYDFRFTRQGFASKIILGEDGKITSERIRLDGSVVTGDFDVVSCVETFVEQHPDFSHNGARGILGLTGYNGILGYRTDPMLASTDGNKYAAKYGVFDVAKEREAVKPVIEALKSEGWEFACNGYNNVSYASGLKEIKEDMSLWKERVGELAGDVDILMYPFGTDIGNWSAYAPKDEKYEYLKQQGFRYFCALDVSGSKNQLTEEYLRCNYRNLDGYRMYRDLYQNAGYFEGLLDFSSLYDQTRPSAAEGFEP